MQSIWLFMIKMAGHRDDCSPTKDNDIQPMVHLLYFSARGSDDATRMAVLVTNNGMEKHFDWTAAAAEKARADFINLFVIGTCRDEPRESVSSAAHNQRAYKCATGSLLL